MASEGNDDSGGGGVRGEEKEKEYTSNRDSHEPCHIWYFLVSENKMNKMERKCVTQMLLLTSECMAHPKERE